MNQNIFYKEKKAELLYTFFHGFLRIAMKRKLTFYIFCFLIIGLSLFLVGKKFKHFTIHEHGFWIEKNAKHYFDEKLAQALVDFMIEERAKVVADFGSGAYGYYVKYFIDHLVPCDGFDGNPFSPELSKNLVSVADLSQPVLLPQKYDWIISLEVGEHIPKDFEKVFLKNLDQNVTKGIVISWAVENQKGKGHVNCQNNAYIKKIFSEMGYENDLQAEHRLRQAAHLGWFHQTLMVFRKVK